MEKTCLSIEKEVSESLNWGLLTWDFKSWVLGVFETTEICEKACVYACAFH